MKSEHVKKLINAHVQEDNKAFNEAIGQIIREEEGLNHNLFVKDLKKILERKNQPNIMPLSKLPITSPIPKDMTKGFPLLEIQTGYYSFEDLILKDPIKDGLLELIEETKNKQKLAAYGLRPRQKLLFYGEPGTGKTLTARIIGSTLGRPLVYVRFDSIVSSYLGETAANLRKVFDFIETGEYVVLFDEFDIIAKKRDDPHEHGEIKRVVNNFMQMLDNYKGTSLIIASTNHEHILDTAVWRRFDDAIIFDMPGPGLRAKLFQKYLGTMKKAFNIREIGLLARQTNGFSPADIQTVCENALRKAIVCGRKEITIQDVYSSIEKIKVRKKVVVKVK